MDRLHKNRSELRSDRSKDKEYRSRSPHSKYEDEPLQDKAAKSRDERNRRKSKSSSPEDNAVKTKTKETGKVSMSSRTSSASSSGIQLKLNVPAKKSLPLPPKPTVSSAFGSSDSEPEEMPSECKMRMRNIGKFTPTSCGPNSYGKTKLGFVDNKKIFEKKMNQMLKDMGD